MGGLIKSLEGVVLAVLLGASMSASETPAFAQQKQAQEKKQEPKKAQEPKKDEVPDDVTQRFREDQVKKAFEEDYKKKDAASKITLANKLAKSADDPKNDVALTYVLKQEAIKAYAEGLDLNSAFSLAERVTESYNTSGLRLKCTAFNIARKLPLKDADQASSVAESGYELTGDLYIKGDFTSSLEIVGEAKKITKLPKEAVQKLTDLESEIKQVQIAELALSATPDDAKSNITVARYTAFRRGKMAEAKDYAKKSKDQVLIDLIDTELINPDNAESQYMIANQYFEASKKLKGFEKDQYTMRASFWYNEALPKSNTLMKADIEKKLKEIQPVEKSKSVDLMKLIDLKKDSVAGTWKWQDGKLMSDNATNITFARIELPYEPSEEYNFTVVFTKVQGKMDIVQILSKAGKSFSLNMGAGNGTLYGFYSATSTSNPSIVTKQVLETNKQYTATVEVRKNGVKAYLDGAQLTEWKPEQKDLGGHPSWILRNEKALGIGSHQDAVLYHKIEVTEVGSGKGKRLR